MNIVDAVTHRHLDEVRRLFIEYERYLNVDLCFQDYAAELAGLPGSYAGPQGVLLLAVDNERPAGCVAVRPLAPNACEMKRLFVRNAHRGTGLGRRLAQRSIHEAVRRGYRTMRLDTLERLHQAVALYTSLGFRRIDPYYHNPLQGVIYLELDLKSVSADP